MTGYELDHPASRALDAALRDALEAGRAVPCTGRHGDWWTSEAADERARAAVLCGPCPILASCAAAADEQDETFGVWAGQDRTPPPASKRGKKGTR